MSALNKLLGQEMGFMCTARDTTSYIVTITVRIFHFQFTDVTTTPDDWKRGTDSPLEQQARERKERMAQQRKIEQLFTDSH